MSDHDSVLVRGRGLTKRYSLPRRTLFEPRRFSTALEDADIDVREGEVLHIPSWIPHQAEAIDDTFEMDIFSPIRQDWLDGTDSYFHDKK